MVLTNPQSSLVAGRVNTPGEPVLACARGFREELPRRATGKGATVPRDGYPLPEELARHAPGGPFAPEELRDVCRLAGEGLGAEDAGLARFRPAAEMVAMWYGLDLPAWVSPYVLRDARLGYLNGYDRTLASAESAPDEVARAARARWGDGLWERKLEAARRKPGGRA